MQVRLLSRMGILEIIKRILGVLGGRPQAPQEQQPEPPVTDTSIEPSLPAADDRLDADAPPATVGDLITPPVPAADKSDRFNGLLRDRRKESSSKHVYGRRDWSKVTGICLHQTACVLGERPVRWDTVGCHAGITRSGQIVWLHDFDKLVVHGNGWNAQTVGLEIDGMYEGIKGNIKTFWRPADEPNRKPQHLTPEARESVKEFIRFICEEVERHGGKIKVIVAHRQSSKNRQSDPGSQIWQEIALEMMKELGLSDGGPGFKIGTGYAIPEAWDSSRKGIKY